MLNLAGNACDHASSGHVALSFSCNAASQTLSITVEDDGPGFSPETIAHGTERFFRGDVSRANAGGAAGGAHFGLGLSIVSNLVEAHGGRLEPSNRKDGDGNAFGARASIVLPLTVAQAQ